VQPGSGSPLLDLLGVALRLLVLLRGLLRVTLRLRLLLDLSSAVFLVLF
jgi:hypothetical protein